MTTLIIVIVAHLDLDVLLVQARHKHELAFRFVHTLRRTLAMIAYLTYSLPVITKTVALVANLTY